MDIRGAVLEECGRQDPFASSRPLSISDLTLDDPGPGEVLVTLEAAGVCHSDLSVVNGDRPRPVPMLLGHEASGRVARLGAGVDDLTVGQRVVIVFLPRCGACEACRTGGRRLCAPATEANAAGTLLHGTRRLHRDGAEVFHHSGVSGFATAAVLHRSSLVPVEDDVPAETAALLGCAVLTGGGAVKNAGALTAGEEVVVVGAGGVGMSAALVAGALGAGRVTVVDTLRGKQAAARELGADAAMSPDELASSGYRAPLVIEATGNPRAFEAAVAATAPGGRTVSVGLAAVDARAVISPLTLVAESRTIIGSFLGSGVPAVDIPEYADLWRAGRLPVERLVTAHLDLDDVNQAMDDLAAGRAMRQVLRF
ncbi:alcohol dehydrogenase catalytic domain-containing protein [Geodermatophilus sp. SYSU D01036]